MKINRTLLKCENKPKTTNFSLYKLYHLLIIFKLCKIGNTDLYNST